MATLLQALAARAGDGDGRGGGDEAVDTEALVAAAVGRERAVQDARNRKVLELLHGKVRVRRPLQLALLLWTVENHTRPQRVTIGVRGPE